ncbi:MAG: hypothetical protein QOG59_370, partial [Solirubrobacteraceae bacterium]|nr:hypothetical protein [Solirubrobacteraceae bacterium]
MRPRRALELIAARGAARTVLDWPGVTAHPHRFGGAEFRYGRRELGHLHGGHLADLPFPRRVRDELIESGRARVHHVLPDSGWVSVPIAGPDDVAGVVSLFRLGYERAVAAEARRAGCVVARGARGGASGYLGFRGMASARGEG